jgi:hypothetical protein
MANHRCNSDHAVSDGVIALADLNLVSDRANHLLADHHPRKAPSSHTLIFANHLPTAHMLCQLSVDSLIYVPSQTIVDSCYARSSHPPVFGRRTGPPPHICTLSRYLNLT